MKHKIIDPKTHALMDYGLGATQMATPLALGLAAPLPAIYAATSVAYSAVNALTDTPAGVYPLLSMKDHQKADIVFLAGLAALGFAPIVRKNPKARLFHFIFLGVALANFCLTDYSNVKAAI